MKNKKYCLILVLSVWSLVIVSIGSIVGISIIDKNHYNSAIDNPPTVNWFEEDLEKVFLSTDVYVYEDYEHEKENIYLTVRANGFYYKTHYYLKHSFTSWYWEYDRHIEIKEVVR